MDFMHAPSWTGALLLALAGSSCAHLPSTRAPSTAELNCAPFAAEIAAAPLSRYGYTWQKCERRDRDFATVPFDENGHFVPSCAPDTLYSWHSSAKVLALAAQSKGDNVLPVPYLYAWRTPLATFGYGDTLIRIKLKPTVKFQPISQYERDCRKLAHVDDTVFVDTLSDPLYLSGTSDYILCSGKVVESWSYGRAEMLDELRQDAAWISTHPDSDFDQYSKGPQEERADFCGLKFKNIDHSDGTDFSPSALAKAFALLRTKIQAQDGKIFFADGAQPSPEFHFATRNPGYFNSRVSREPKFSAANFRDPTREPAFSIYLLEQAAIDKVRNLRQQRGNTRPGEFYSTTYENWNGSTSIIIGVAAVSEKEQCAYEVTLNGADHPGPWAGETKQSVACLVPAVHSP